MLLYFLYTALLAILTLSEPSFATRRSSNSVLLTSVKTLTLRKDAKTSHRRVSAIPQLKCVGGNGRGLYEVDVMRCKNQGSDYDDDNIQWTCTASLPEEFKLGATDVICEGYDSPQDPYILKGSCGVEYRLILTEKGEERYARGGVIGGFKPRISPSAALFWIVFIVVVAWIIYSAFVAYQGAPRARRPPRNGGFWGGGWGGGGGGGGGGYNPYDPPPPYPGYPHGKPSSSRGPGFGQEGWRPGFWTGALSGAAAGYAVGSRGARQPQPQPRSSWFGDNSSGTGWGVGPSIRPSTRSSSSSGSSSRYESTGFGSTSRR